jgi:ketosteroid isomerase-like protein
MPEPAQNVELVRRAFGAALAGDCETLQGVVHEDFSWTVPGASRVAGVVVGVDAFAAKLRTVFVAGVEVELLDVLASATRVATVQRNRAPGDPGLDITVINLFHVREGRVTSMETFPSDLYALETFWGPPTPPAAAG